MKNRITELRYVDPKLLAANPLNWRKHPSHQANALQAVLDTVGIADAMLAYEDDSGVLTLIDGHLRTELMQDVDTVPVLILDVTDEEARTLLATLDPLASMAGTDDTALEDLLSGLADAPGLESLLAAVADTYDVSFGWGDADVSDKERFDGAMAVEISIRIARDSYSPTMEEAIRALADQYGAKVSTKGLTTA